MQFNQSLCTFSEEELGQKLIEALRSDDAPLFKSAIDQGYDVNRSLDLTQEKVTDDITVKSEVPPLCAVIDLDPKSSLSMLKSLMAKKPDLKVVCSSKRDWTPLLFLTGKYRRSFRDYYTDMTEVLLEGGADANRTDSYNYSALNNAAGIAKGAGLGMVKLLLKKGHAAIDAPNKSGKTPLHRAMDIEDASVARFLLEYVNHPDPDAKGKDTRTPASVALNKKSYDFERFKVVEKVKLLIEHGADYDTVESRFGYSSVTLKEYLEQSKSKYAGTTKAAPFKEMLDYIANRERAHDAAADSMTDFD